MKIVSVPHDAHPFDGHTYRVTLIDGRAFDAVARRSHSGANVIFATLNDDGTPTGGHLSEISRELAKVERVTDTPERPLNLSPTLLSRPHLRDAA